MEIRLEELTRHYVVKAKHVFVYNPDGTATIVRRWPGLPPMMAAETPAPLMPEDLFVYAPRSVEDPVAMVRAALEYLGFRCDVSLKADPMRH